jgi:hypothetical protein
MHAACWQRVPAAALGRCPSATRTPPTHHTKHTAHRTRTEQQVCVEAALVCLIKQDHAVGPQQEVGLQLPHQHAVGQEAHGAVRAHTLVVAHLGWCPGGGGAYARVRDVCVKQPVGA